MSMSETIDWNLCIICQETTTEELRCPIHDPLAVYNVFIKNVEEFKKINSLPIEIDFREGGSTLLQNHAKWHKQCHQKFNNTKLEPIEALGKSKYEKYVADVIDNRTSSIHDTIKKNSLSLFNTPKCKFVLDKSQLFLPAWTAAISLLLQIILTAKCWMVQLLSIFCLHLVQKHFLSMPAKFFCHLFSSSCKPQAGLMLSGIPTSLVVSRR